MGPRKDKQVATSSRGRGKRFRRGESAAVFNRNIFIDEHTQQRYEMMQGWNFNAERRVELKEGEYTEFNNEITRRKWRILAEPASKFDADVVKEFYANAWPSQEGCHQKRSKVRGKWISYDRDTINEFLGSPMELNEGEICTYERIRRARGLTERKFDNDAVAQLLCIPGRTYETNHAGKPLRILRPNMTTITQIWTSFLLANIVPLKHSSDLNMARCYMVYCILNGYSLDVAGLISKEIHQFVMQESGPQTGQAKALGFPSLITALCAANGVDVNPSHKIRPPIDMKFVDKYCVNRLEQQVQAPQPQPHRTSEQREASSSQPQPQSDLTDYMRRLELHMTHVQSQQAAIHRGQVSLNESFHRYSISTHSPVPWPTVDEFRALVQWPGDHPDFSHRGEVEPSNEGDDTRMSSGDDDDNDDENLTDSEESGED